MRAAPADGRGVAGGVSGSSSQSVAAIDAVVIDVAAATCNQ
jgi:hypothetical protein